MPFLSHNQQCQSTEGKINLLDYNLNKLKPIFIIFAHYILIVLPFKGTHHFPPNLIFTYRTLQFISIVQNDPFSHHCHVSKHAI